MGLDTKAKILQAAEVEFAESGFEGASIRNITNRAQVNLASVNYHFGNKEELFKEMVRNRIEPINQERLGLLDKAIEAQPNGTLPLNQVIDIVLRPLLKNLIEKGGPDFHFMRAMGRGMSEELPFIKEMYLEILKEILPRFTKAISESLENPDFKRIAYGMHFLSCIISGALLQHRKLEFASGGKIDLNDIDGLVDHLVAFVSGGLLAIKQLEE